MESTSAAPIHGFDIGQDRRLEQVRGDHQRMGNQVVAVGVDRLVVQ